jgi:hypothetical protein
MPRYVYLLTFSNLLTDYIRQKEETSQRKAIEFILLVQCQLTLKSKTDASKAFLLMSYLFLGAFAQFRKATINFVMSLCPSVRISFRRSSIPSACLFFSQHGTTRLPPD